jgi:hypothetical protein
MLTTHDSRSKDSQIIGLDEVTPWGDRIKCGNDGAGMVPSVGKFPRIRPWKAAHDLSHFALDLAGIVPHHGG